MSVPFFANINFVFSGDAKKLREDYVVLQASVAKMNEFMGKMVKMLNKRGSLTDTELTELIEHYTELASPNLNAAITIAQKNQNPLTPAEVSRLQGLMDKAKKHGVFSPEEINDYHMLVEKARQESTKENPWPLIALAAFLLGLVIASQDK